MVSIFLRKPCWMSMCSSLTAYLGSKREAVRAPPTKRGPKRGARARPWKLAAAGYLCRLGLLGTACGHGARQGGSAAV